MTTFAQYELASANAAGSTRSDLSGDNKPFSRVAQASGNDLSYVLSWCGGHR